jgi:hypothetical protein
MWRTSDITIKKASYSWVLNWGIMNFGNFGRYKKRSNNKSIISGQVYTIHKIHKVIRYLDMASDTTISEVQKPDTHGF